jgi:hypothetical protein
LGCGLRGFDVQSDSVCFYLARINARRFGLCSQASTPISQSIPQLLHSLTSWLY